MAAAMRDLDPATFDPNADLLSLVTDLQMTAIVGMIATSASMPAVTAAGTRTPTSISATLTVRHLVNRQLAASAPGLPISSTKPLPGYSVRPS